MIAVIAKHGYVDKQYYYFIIVSLEPFCQIDSKCILARGLTLCPFGDCNKHDLLLDTVVA